jgi:hypothetical protein
MLTPSPGGTSSALLLYFGVVRIVAIVAALLAVVGAQASQPAARPLVGLKAPEGPLLGMVWIGRDAEIVPLDATTLEPAGAALPITEGGAFGYSPDRSQLALGAVNPPRVRFVDVAPLKVVRSVQLGRIGNVDRIDWLGAGAAVVLYAAPDGTRIAWVDPTTGEVSKRVRLGVTPYQAVTGGGRLVLLLPPRKGIGTARLEIVGADERTRVVRLPKIRIGSTMPGARTAFRRIQPGLALDASTGHAYVVGTDSVVADVDVRSLRVSNHSLVRRSLAARIGAWLVPAAEAKALAGPALDARWLGDGLIAVAGTSYSVTFGKDSETQSATPLGLRVVDVRTWTQRTLDAGADGFAVGNDALLAYGVRSKFGTTAPPVVSGMGVAAYGTDGSARFHLLPTVPVGSLQVNGSLAYGWLVDPETPSWHLVVLDVAAGTVVRELRLAHPTRLLISDNSFF